MKPLPVIVAIPARNEAGRVAACLDALAAQPGAGRHIAVVTILANNCTDATVAVARSMVLPFAVDVVDVQLPPGEAHIGHARRGATDLAVAAMQSLGLDDAIIANTDADSRVEPGWLSALLAAMAPGVDAVCGSIDLDRPVPPTLSAARAAETRYADAIARAAALLDPIEHDPWPNHIWCWGANLAVRARSLLKVGGFPLVDLAEDRALHTRLLHHDARIRHSIVPKVVTSARQDGRAPGGFADLMNSYATDADALADYWLEPASLAWRRAASRGAARRLWGDRPGFGAWWARRQASDPGLMPMRVAVGDLARETNELLGWISAATGRADTPLRAAAGREPHPIAVHG